MTIFEYCPKNPQGTVNLYRVLEVYFNMQANDLFIC